MTDLKIHICLDIVEGPFGGSHQFLRTLKNCLQKRGQYAERPEQANVFLFNSSQDIKKVLRIKKKYPNAVYVHRIDGLMRLYNKKSDFRDSIVKAANITLADGTIFQSQWSFDQNKIHGFKFDKFHTIITNAADNTIFNVKERKISFPGEKLKIIATSWSSNWKKGFRTYQWLDNHLDFSQFKMTFIGNSPTTFKHIRYLPPMCAMELAKELKKSDIYITASEKESCSNALIEAMQCGLPAIAIHDGGNPEIIKNGGETFSSNEEIIPLLEKIQKSYSTYRSNIELPTIDDIADSYCTFIDKIRQEQNAEKYNNRKLSLIKESQLVAILKWGKIHDNFFSKKRK